MEITQCTSFRKNTNSKSFPAMVASLFPRNQINQMETRKRADFKNARISNRRRRRRALALFSSCAPPLPRRHVNRMKRLLEATLTPAIKPETLLWYDKTGSRTHRPIEMGYESSAVEIRARRGLLTWWNKRSPVKMDESSWVVDELSCCPPSFFSLWYSTQWVSWRRVSWGKKLEFFSRPWHHALPKVEEGHVL
jgi:hypothetical protein